MLNHSKKLTILIFTVFIGFPTIVFAQDEAAFDLRFLIHSVECYNNILYCDIQIRAKEPEQEFRVGNQEYSISFDSNTLSDPFISEGLYISGLVYEPGEHGFSAYDAPIFLVSDTLIHYGLTFAGGDGIYLDAEEYVGVARLGFHIVDDTKPVHLVFNPLAVYPGTRVLVADSTNYLTGSHLGYHQSIMGACENAPPQAAYNHQITAEGQAITICLAENDTDPEGLLDLTSVELLSVPPASEGTVTLDALTGCITFTPHPDFSGVTTTFEYQICDEGVQIPSYGGNENPMPLPLPDPDNPDLVSHPPACDTATVTITVDATLVGTGDGDAAFFGLTTFPNPVDEVLNISYQLPEKADVSLSLWNTLGQQIIQLRPQTQTADNYHQRIDVSHLNAGHYLMTLRANDRLINRLIHINKK